jgi:hypothetical protein
MQIFQSYPAPPPRGVTRDSHITSKRYRDTEIQTLIQTNHSKLHCAAPLGVRRGSLPTNSKRNRDTDSLTHKEIYRLSQSQIVQSCLAPPSGARDATANIQFKAQQLSLKKHTIYKASKPKLTPPYQVLRKLLTPPSPALRKQLQHSKEQRRLITPSVVLIIKSGRIKSQDLKLNDIKSCMVTLLLARTFHSIACSAFGVCSVAFIHLMLGLHLRCREGIHSQRFSFHGATSFKKTSHTFMVSTQTQSEISNIV